MAMSSIYENLVSPHLDDLRKYCRYLTGSRWDAEDLYQNTLLKSLVYFLHTEPYVDVKPFLIRVSRNLWIDECRKRRRRRLAATDQPVSYGGDGDYAEVRGTIEWLAERLPRRNLETWLLFHYFGYSMQEVARATGTTVSAVKSLLHRTRETIRGPEPPARRKYAKRDAERWSKAILLERPRAMLADE